MGCNLVNGGFEADWEGEKSHRCLVFAPDGTFVGEREIGNIFTPPGWLTWFVHEPGTWDQPEVRDAWGDDDERRAHTGAKGILLFTFSRRHDAGFLQQVQVEPGVTLRLSAWAHAWSNHRDPAYPDRFPHPDDPWWSEGVGWAPRNEEHEPIGAKNWYLEGEAADDQWRNFTFHVGIDPTGGTNPLADTVVWSRGIHIYNEYTASVPPVQVKAQAATATVFLRSTTLWPFKHNDAYWDDVELVAVGPSSTTTTTSTTTLSTTTTTLLPPPGECRVGVLIPYLREIQGTIDRMIEEIENIEPPPPPDGIALCQCDPRWASETFGDPASCSLTYCAAGCYLTCLAMALRHYGMQSNATPVVVNDALIPGGYSGCRPLWSAIKSELGLAVSSPSNVDDDLVAGQCAMAEVLPSSLEHFVLVTEKAGDSYLCYDPIDGQQRILSSKYQGIESWRLLVPVEKPPPPELPPWAGMVPISLHVQQPTAHDGYGDLEFVRDVKPAGFKVVGHMQQLQRVKAVSPNTVTIFRQFVDNQGQYWDVDPRDGAREFLYTFLDSLNELRDSVDLVEGLNEIGVPNELTRLSDWYCYLAEALAAEGSPAGPAVGSIPVGNPKLVSEGGKPQIEEILPMVRAAVEHNGAVNYHGYHRVYDGVIDPPWDVNWLCYAGRCLEDWDAVFREHSLYPNYIISEAGAFLNALAGWRHGEVFSGDWGAYGQSLLQLREHIDAWNAENNYRCICYTLFTYANPGIWQHYNLYGYARALAELLGG